MTMSPRNAGMRDTASRIFSRVAGAAWAALAIYCVLSLLVGPAGVLSYQRLAVRTLEMRRNLDELGEANERLRVELESLRSDADRAAREARGLGYLRPDESAILVAGRSSPRIPLETGKVLAFVPPRAWPDSALKEIALGTFLAVLAIGLAPRKTR